MPDAVAEKNGKHRVEGKVMVSGHCVTVTVSLSLSECHCVSDGTGSTVSRGRSW